MKAVILSNQARSMSIFWKVLITKLLKDNIEVICLVPPGDEKSEKILQNMGAQTRHFPLERKGLNPFKDLASLVALNKFFSSEKPDLLFSTTIKPVIYGSLAARMAAVPAIFATITGLGYAFEKDSLPKKLLNKLSNFLYRLALNRCNAVFFQNRDDWTLFRAENILDNRTPVCLARGTGVDIEHFAEVPLPPVPQKGALTFILVGRLLEAKGIAEYAMAAEKLRQKWPNARFLLLGPRENGPGSISDASLDVWLANGAIEYLGEAQDVRPHLAKAHVAVLPSWREGTPTAIMEAMSMGRPCVVSDVPGCREVVENGRNGWLCKAHDSDSLAETMEKFLLNPEALEPMAKEGRRLAENVFSATKVANGIINDMIRHAPNLEWPVKEHKHD